MILAALRDKLRARGPLGFASDAAELALSYAVAAPFVVWELLARAPAATGCVCANQFEECRCGRGAAADRTSCRNAEEPGS